MVEITITPKKSFGYALAVIGIVIIVFAILQAALTIGTIMEFVNELSPNPTMGQWIDQWEANAMPGFVEILGWFFMLIIELLGGFFIANIGQKFTKD